MQSNRIKNIQRRAKRRFLALAIVTTAFVGYNALSLFAEEDHPIQLPVAKLSTAPAVKSVGIRLINPNGKSSAPSSESATTLTSIGPALLLPPSPSPPEGYLSSSNKVVATLPTASLTGVGSTASQSQSPIGFSSLMPPPPPMSEVLTKNSNGKVVVKLGNSENTTKLQSHASGPTYLPTPIPIGSTEDLAGIRDVKSPTMGATTEMPPILFEGSGKTKVANKEQADQTSASSPNRVSVVDNKNNTHSIDRNPQLVKPKPTQITHSVVLAQSTELELPTSESQSSDFGPMLEVETSSVPRSISNDLLGSTSKSSKKLQYTVSLSDVVPDPIPSQSTPSITSATAKSEGIDSMRRKFDTRKSNQSHIATVELECLAATSMDLSGKLCGVAVQDAGVCKILHNDRTISMIGNQVGSTLVQVWTADRGDKPQVVRVNVSQPWGNVQATRSEVKDIKQAIAQNFPRADVSIVSLEDGGIEVKGTTDSEESARRILELVRKLYLVPVKDRVTVSN